VAWRSGCIASFGIRGVNASLSAIDAGFVFAVTGAALCPWPWLALIVGAAWMVALVVVADRRTPAEEPKA
jgi:hypothetical protein